MAFSFMDYLGSKFQPDSGIGGGTPVTNAGNMTTQPIAPGYGLGPGSADSSHAMVSPGRIDASNVQSMPQSQVLGGGGVQSPMDYPGYTHPTANQRAAGPMTGSPDASSGQLYNFNVQAPAGTPSYMQLKPGQYQYNNILENLIAQNGVNKNWNYGEGGEAGSPEFVRNPDGIDPNTGQSKLTPEQRQKNWEQRYYWMQNNYSQMPEKLDPNYVPLNAEYNRNNPQALAQLQSIANGQGSSPGFTQEGAARQLWQWGMEKQGAGLEPGSAASPLGRYHTPDGRIFDVKTMQQVGVDPGSAAHRAQMASTPRFSNYVGGGTAAAAKLPNTYGFNSANLLNQTPENTPGYWQAYQNYYTNGPGAATNAPTVQDAARLANYAGQYGAPAAQEIMNNGGLNDIPNSYYAPNGRSYAGPYSPTYTGPYYDNYTGTPEHSYTPPAKKGGGGSGPSAKKE